MFFRHPALCSIFYIRTVYIKCNTKQKVSKNMENIRRKSIALISFILCVSFLCGSIAPLKATAAEFSDKIDAKSAILMEASSGKVLFEQNADEPLPPASVTKIMTLLLVMEAIDGGKIELTDIVSVSENAASMGGSQVFLEPGEQMSVEDMIKSVVVSSANDAAVALAEHIAGSESSFVSMMNERASELGMANTHFENTNGLDDSVSEHLISARDIAIMSKELLKHEKILDYTNIWQDTIRNGAFTLSNTNRLIRFYEGANGLKTGSTSKAKFCISATAKRNGMQLICVIMGSPTRDIRNAEAKKLLDYGFANYGVYNYAEEYFEELYVRAGNGERITAVSRDFSCVIDKSKIKTIEKQVELYGDLTAPIGIGDEIGKISFFLDGECIGVVPICTMNQIDKITMGKVLFCILNKIASII